MNFKLKGEDVSKLFKIIEFSTEQMVSDKAEIVSEIEIYFLINFLKISFYKTEKNITFV